MPHHHHRRSLHPVSDRLIESLVPSITFLAIVTHFSALNSAPNLVTRRV
jgi:hypothetical protein